MKPRSLNGIRTDSSEFLDLVEDYLNGMNYSEIGKKVGRTAERVRVTFLLYFRQTRDPNIMMGMDVSPKNQRSKRYMGSIFQNGS